MSVYSMRDLRARDRRLRCNSGKMLPKTVSYVLHTRHGVALQILAGSTGMFARELDQVRLIPLLVQYSK